METVFVHAIQVSMVLFVILARLVEVVLTATFVYPTISVVIVLLVLRVLMVLVHKEQTVMDLVFVPLDSLVLYVINVN